MKIFSRKKCIDWLRKTTFEEHTRLEYITRKWADSCDGHVADNGSVKISDDIDDTTYKVSDYWCIDSIDIVDYFKSNNIAVKIDSDWEYETFMHILKEHDIKWISGKECSRKSKTIIPERFRKDICLSYVTMTLYGFCVVEGLTWGTPKDFEFTKDTVISYSELIDRVYNKDKSKEAINDYVNKNSVYHHSYCDMLTRVIKKISLNDTNPSDNERSTFEKNTKAPAYDIQITSDGKTTMARFFVDGHVVREAEARCHPNDRFNFHTGAEVAFNRLFEKQPKSIGLDVNNKEESR